MKRHARKIGVGASLAVTALIITACGSESEVAEAPEQDTAVSSPAPATPSSEAGNVPGAMIGNGQRTWPDPDGMFDDSAHAEPGTWSVDFAHQRPVWTPRNHDGDLPARGDLVDGGFEQCANGNVTLEGVTQQQYVNARYLAVNDEAGPSRVDNGVPGGFAHSPQGAIMLAINALGYGAAGQGDGVGEEIDATWWSNYDTLQKDREFRGLNDEDYDHSRVRAQTLPAVGYYNVQQCSENVVVVEVGHDFTQSGDEALRVTVPLYWRDGDWIPDLSGQAGVTFDKTETFSPEEPAPLKEVNYQ
ncbi:hypothetical protein ACXZ66_04055 [Corynebacterium sp. S7]